MKFEVHADLYLIRVGLDSSPDYGRGDQRGARNLLLWLGLELEDREPVYAGDGEWGLGCPCAATDEAGAARQDAIEMFRSMGMHFWLSRALGGASGSVTVP